MFRQKITFLVAACVLGGCGAEVAGTATTTAGLQAAQIEQARAQEAQFKQKLDEAMKASEAAASTAGTK